MHSANGAVSGGRRSSQKRRQIAPSLIIGSPQPRASTRARAISAVLASQSPALTNSAVKVGDLLRRHRNFRDQSYGVAMFPLHSKMYARNQPVSQSLPNTTRLLRSSNSRDAGSLHCYGPRGFSPSENPSCPAGYLQEFPEYALRRRVEPVRLRAGSTDQSRARLTTSR